jgi:hypothetical protein
LGPRPRGFQRAPIPDAKRPSQFRDQLARNGFTSPGQALEQFRMVLNELVNRGKKRRR